MVMLDCNLKYSIHTLSSEGFSVGNKLNKRKIAKNSLDSSLDSGIPDNVEMI